MPSDYETAKKMDEMARSGEKIFECENCKLLRDQRDSLMKILVGARPVLTAHDKRRFDVLRKEIRGG